MNDDTRGLSVTKPISAWKKPIQVDVKASFVALSKAASAGFTGDLDVIVADLISAVGLETKPEELAWLLVHRALTKAMFDLASEKRNTFTNFQGDSNNLLETLDLSLEKTELSLSFDFFENPAKISILSAITIPFHQWLKGFGFREDQAQSICDRLPRYFIYALNDEWRERATDYKPLQEHLNTPFVKAERKESDWLRYHAWLRRQVDEPLFDESFSLRQIYVPLRGYYQKKVDSRRDDVTEQRIQYKRYMVDL